MKTFIRINNIIVPLDNVKYITKQKTSIIIALGDGLKNEIFFESETSAEEFFDALEKQLISDRDVTSEDWDSVCY